MIYEYRTKGTCSSRIRFDLTDGLVSDVHFEHGCSGNLRAIAKLVEGLPASLVIEKLAGNLCDGKSTSCADQLAQALTAAQALAAKDAQTDNA